MQNQAEKLLGSYKNHAQADIVHIAASTPTGTSLMEIFNRHSGVIAFKPIPEPNVIAQYQKSFFGADKITLGPNSKDNSVIHELRHHQQYILQPRLKTRSLRDYALLCQWAEADARAVEMLHALEKIENAKAAGATTKSILNLIMTTNNYDFSESKSLTNRLLHFYYLHNNDILPRAEKMQIMREVFDNYLIKNSNIDNFYHQKQLERIEHTKPVSLHLPTLFASLVAVELLTTDNVLGFTVIALTLQGVTVLALRQYFAAAECAETATATTGPGLLASFGTMPHGQGNYLTSTKGPALNHDLYQHLPPQLELALTAKKSILYKAAHPFAALKDKCAKIAKNIQNGP